ncbi:MAG: c-type cytochrome [Magnetococcales bacterium]|nr:c-type cytochrome [Magnetococcales bacterium]
MKKLGLTLTAALFSLTFAASPSFAADAVKGMKYAAKKCAMCHNFGPKIKKKGKIGPSLADGIMGKKAGQVAKFKYSKAMKKAADGGLVWNEENLDAFLKKPKKFLKKTKMAFPGIKKKGQRDNVIEFLKSI